jgi:ABC-type multidrug transport system fused ATPase/permease subunit
MARPDADDAAISAAARAAHADEFIRRLPQGYATPLGEGAGELSGGQRQRLALARTLVRPTPLVLLDEPTAQLDGASGADLRDSLAVQLQDRTALIITHDPALAAIADQVINLDEPDAVELTLAADCRPVVSDQWSVVSQCSADH